MADQQEVRCPTLFVGELSLDGGLRGVRRVLPIAIEAEDRKIIPIEVSAVGRLRISSLGRLCRASSAKP